MQDPCVQRGIPTERLISISDRKLRRKREDLGLGNRASGFREQIDGINVECMRELRDGAHRRIGDTFLDL